MSDIVYGLRKHLIGTKAVADLVGGRVYPGFLPQKPDIMPSIVISLVSGESEHHLTGGAGLAHTTVQVDCIADDHLTAHKVLEAVRTKVIPSTKATWDSIAVADVGHENFRDDVTPRQDGSDHWRFVAGFDLLISHEEAEPA